MAHVLVTGGAGYIGAHACKALARAGYTPVTYDNLSTGWQDAVKFGPFEQGDLLDRDRLDEVFATWNPIAVMHFAALSQVGEAMAEPGKYWRNNVSGSLYPDRGGGGRGLSELRLFSSTCATYGDQDNVVLDEDSAQMPLNAYGASKRAIEDILRDFERRLWPAPRDLPLFQRGRCRPRGRGRRIPPPRNASDPGDAGGDSRASARR